MPAAAHRLRGFALNQAGPRDSAGFPVGGQALLEFHQELRFPMRLPFIGTALGGALFYDGGNVYSRLAPYHLSRVARPNPFSIRRIPCSACTTARTS